jgi:hypothetical protein
MTRQSGGGCQAPGNTARAEGEDHHEKATAVADDPAIYEEVWHPAAVKSFVSLRVDLAKVSEERV